MHLEFYDASSNSVINSLTRTPYGNLHSSSAEKCTSGVPQLIFKSHPNFREANITITTDGGIKKEQLGSRLPLSAGKFQDITNLGQPTHPRPDSGKHSVTPQSQNSEDLEEPEHVEQNDNVCQDEGFSEETHHVVHKKSKKGKKSRNKKSRSSKTRRSQKTVNADDNGGGVVQNIFGSSFEAKCNRVRLSTPPVKPIKANIDYSAYVSNRAPHLLVGTNSNNIHGSRVQDPVKSWQGKYSAPLKPGLPRTSVQLTSAYKRQQLGIDSKQLGIESKQLGKESKQLGKESKPDGVHHTRNGSHYVTAKHEYRSLPESSLSVGVPPEDCKVTKKYLSEKQSKNIEELGQRIPAVPPASPRSGVANAEEKVEYVKSMADNKSQRAVRMKLNALQSQRKAVQEQTQSENRKKQKVKEHEEHLLKRRDQRRKIYELNELMTKFENRNFIRFCQDNDIYCPERRL